MNKEELAAKLNGREMGEEMDGLQKLAKDAGLVVVYGASDDLMEIDGAIRDEVGCNDGREVPFLRSGPLEEHDCECKYCGYGAEVQRVVIIEAVWDSDGYSWTYKTKIPHATFDIMEDGEKYCRGIVFELESLPE